MKEYILTILTILIYISGAVLIVKGAYMITPVLGYIVSGLFLLWLATVIGAAVVKRGEQEK